MSKKFLRTSLIIGCSLSGGCVGSAFSPGHAVRSIEFCCSDQDCHKQTVLRVLVDGHKTICEDKGSQGRRLKIGESSDSNFKYMPLTQSTGPYSLWVHDPDCHQCKRYMNQDLPGITVNYEVDIDGDVSWKFVNLPPSKASEKFVVAINGNNGNYYVYSPK